MKQSKVKSPWQGKIINRAQVGGIETSVLDNGLGKGVRIAWFNTGSPLRYKVVIDRALDIVEAFYNQHSLAWLSHAGTTEPKPDVSHSLEWFYSFGAGLVTTCGLTHIGGPEIDEYGERGIHGRISNIPAEIESIVQPDPVNGKLEMSITALIKQTRLFGPNLELRRTISSTIGRPTIKIHDVVTNRGNQSAPHMILYHCNFGWPLVDEGTQILWKGKWTTAGRDMDNAIFNKSRDFHKCCPPLEAHSGTGEAWAAIDITADKKGLCTAGLYNQNLGLAAVLSFKKKQLPWLTNWQHWGRGEYVTALEPGTNPPIGQSKARKQKKLIHIAPADSRAYDLEITALTDDKQIKKFLSTTG
jgi:hypothetical protein